MAETENGAAEQPADDLRSIIAAAAEADEAAQADAAAATPAEEGAAETGETTEGRKRDATGRFATKTDDGEPAKTEPADPAATAAETDTTEKQPTETPAAQAPEHWSQADKEMVASLPVEHRIKVIDRIKAIENGFNPRLQEAAELKRQYGGAAELFQPYTEALRQRNQTPSDIIKQWAGIEQTFVAAASAATRGEPYPQGAQAVANIIRSYKIDPAEVAQFLTNPTGPAPAANHPPAVDPELLRRISSVEDVIKSDAEARRSAALNDANNQIRTFADAKDASGALLRPHFSEVEQKIEQLARLEQAAGKPLDLQDLYDQAVWATPSTREKVRLAEREAADRKAADEAKARAAAARKSGASVSGAPSPGSSAPASGSARSVRDSIEAALEDAA